MAEALETLVAVASAREAGKWVREVAAERLTERALQVAAVESTPLASQIKKEALGVDDAPGQEASGSRAMADDDELLDEDGRPSGVTRRTGTPVPSDDEALAMQHLEAAMVDAGLDLEAAPGADAAPAPAPAADEPAAELALEQPAEPAADAAPAPEPVYVDDVIKASVGRSSRQFVVLGAVAFAAILGALAWTIWQDQQRAATVPDASDSAATAASAEPAAPSTAEPSTSEPAGTTGPSPDAEMDASAADTDATSTDDPTSRPGGPAVRQPRPGPSEFTPPGI
jgi:hypothetical protein